ncbi:acyltransferase family protein [Pseudoduganella namucuonensis]|uniref:Peptidoglycan/LPS O-acetylase OafA/YrhL, contains acyltransferase and SGNH-hydrolase domains n=1 Tax=Pseudoduganella namucuonensis TaxID=1035707 RepID=A0A1I7K2J1_9BURK|nr:acyltransferase family protein [Pseudoduganella namucuonensis]SFU91644.1 Peptidoglycan/LPS O-acetylase OafA/YrhL, contains acyltransferase and SGNH-hydrolase domains [Pseudoduganella namucuonensis]
MPPDSSYRPDIDGLRALAVLAVIAFHASPATLGGGYAGVDIFFAISGFLITGLILRALEQDDFSLAEFYNRRVKRLLPAYCAVTVFTLAMASYLMIPNDYVFYTTSLAASWAFVSNVFFSLLSWGYFGQRTEEFPLLHTWSLSLEEQFYFGYPLLLILLHRRCRRHLPAILSVLALAALLLSEWRATGPGASAGAYFLLPYRAHELLLGALAACALLRRAPPPPRVAAVLAALGLCLALAPLALLRRGSPFPGLNSLYPCLGAALLLYAGARANPVSALLTASPLVAVGRISYSLYLWHWPLFSFLRYRRIELDLATGTAVIALSFALAYLSWRYIEQPLRRQHHLRLRATLPRYYALPAACCLAVGLYSYATEGAPSRFSPEARQLIASYSFERDLTGACAIQAGAYHGVTLAYLRQHCVAGDPHAARPAILLFGDSHANHVKPFLATLARDGGLAMAYHFEGSCSAIDLRPNAPNPAAATTCQRRNADLLALAPHFRYVALATYWKYKGREADFARDLDVALSRIAAAGAIPVVFKDTPSLQVDMSRCVLFRQRGWVAPSTNCNMPADQVRARQGSMDAVIDALRLRYPQTIVIDPKRLMCDTRECVTSIGNVALFKDINHINLQASELLARLYLRAQGNPFTALPDDASARHTAP